MGRDASLDEFLGWDDADEERDADAEPADGPRGERDDRDDAGLSTFDWSPDGAPCGACGDRVERRWRDGDALVCEACKDW